MRDLEKITEIRQKEIKRVLQKRKKKDFDMLEMNFYDANKNLIFCFSEICLAPLKDNCEGVAYVGILFPHENKLSKKEFLIWMSLCLSQKHILRCLKYFPKNLEALYDSQEFIIPLGKIKGWEFYVLMSIIRAIYEFERRFRHNKNSMWDYYRIELNFNETFIDFINTSLEQNNKEELHKIFWNYLPKIFGNGHWFSSSISIPFNTLRKKLKQEPLTNLQHYRKVGLHNVYIFNYFKDGNVYLKEKKVKEIENADKQIEIGLPF